MVDLLSIFQNYYGHIPFVISSFTVECHAIIEDLKCINYIFPISYLIILDSQSSLIVIHLVPNIRLYQFHPLVS